MRRLTNFRALCHRQWVAGVSRLQVRSRGVAAFTAVWLLVCGVLAGRHEATVGHVRTSASVYVHGSVLTGHHESQNSDVHGRGNPGDDTGECAVLAAFHQAASAHVTAPAVVSTARATQVHDIPGAAALVVAARVYRFAPKTSPPVAA